MVIPEIKKILYTTDLSENSRFAFGYAASIANRYDAAVSVLYVVEDLHAGSETMVAQIVGEERWKDLREKNRQQVIDTIRARLTIFCDDARQEMSECAFITDEIIVKSGNAVETILHEAEKGEYDMIVMGSHGMGMMADAMIGSTSRRVLRRCKKPVLVIRLPGD